MQSGKVVRSLKLSMRLALLGAAVVSGPVYACAVEPYIGAVCVMAWPKNVAFGGNTYVSASGQALSINQYQALYALIGTTYGGAGTNFNVPDLRGRTVVGAGTYSGPEGQYNYVYGKTGGAMAVSLNQNQLPVHAHPISASTAPIATGIGSLRANTTLSGLSATTSMAGVSGSVNGSALSLWGNNGTANGTTAGGSALATPTGPANKIYSSSAPNVSMAANSIQGTAAVSFSGSPTTTVTGTPATTLSGAPVAAINGGTGTAGAGTPVSLMQPYMALSYYIAVNGVFPTPD